MKFTREKLQEIRDNAIAEAESCNKTWKRAFLRLAEAADYLDAMEARTEERTQE